MKFDGVSSVVESDFSSRKIIMISLKTHTTGEIRYSNQFGSFFCQYQTCCCFQMLRTPNDYLNDKILHVLCTKKAKLLWSIKRRDSQLEVYMRSFWDVWCTKDENCSTICQKLFEHKIIFISFLIIFRMSRTVRKGKNTSFITAISCWWPKPVTRLNPMLHFTKFRMIETYEWNGWFLIYLITLTKCSIRKENIYL